MKYGPALHILVACLGVAIGSTALNGADGADTIYSGGFIITMNDTAPYAGALAVKDGKILAVGPETQVMKTKGATTKLVDLGGKTLLPGFVDAHGHFSEVGLQSTSANLLPAPDGPVNNIPALQQTMREFIAQSAVVKAHGTAIGMNYDDSQLAEHRHPTRQELDAISTEVAILITHQSGHLCTLNSKALALVGYGPETADPAGGVIRREADGKTPNGVLEENAWFGIMGKIFPPFSPDEVMTMFQASQNIYLANGYTTIQEGKTSATNLKVLPVLAAKGILRADIVSYPDIIALGDAPVLHGPLMSHTYSNHFRIAGVKLTLDGSPQGKTAWFTAPYYKVPEGQKADYRGYPALSDEDLRSWMTVAYKNNWQLLAHANGDAAIDQFIEAVRTVAAAHPGAERRTVIIHAQFLRADQIPQLKELGIFPSLYPMHTFYWGDWHRESVAGPVRAEYISPTADVLASGMKFSIHHDAPVTFPNSMRILDSAVNRTTRSGYVLGAKQRIEPIVALKAMTLWAAYQHFEDATKGSLEVGKCADLVILDRNPLTVDHATLKDIKVLETIKDGITVYSSSAPQI